MARFLTLLRFTDQGAKNIKKSTARAKAFAKLAAKAGATIECQFWTTGGYDGFFVISAPDETAALRCVAELSAAGNVHTKTLAAFDADEFQRIVSR